MEIHKRPASQGESNTYGRMEFCSISSYPNFQKGKKKRKKCNKIKAVKMELDPEIVKEIDYTEIPGETIVGGIYTRVVIIGDHFISRYNTCWPTSSKIKPFFLIKNKLNLQEMYLKFKDHRFLKDSKSILVIFMFSPHLFATYDTYKSPTCVGDHLPIEFVKEMELRKIQSRYMETITDAMLEAKKQFEINDSLTVTFSYFPEFEYFKRLHESFAWSRKNVPNCSCQCYTLEAKHIRLNRSRFKIAIPFANRVIYKALLSAPKENVFEFIPLQVLFQNGHFNIGDNNSSDKKDVVVLNICVTKQVFGDEQYTGFITEGMIKENISIDTSMMNMRKTILGVLTDKFRILIIGDNWLNFILSEWNACEKSRPFVHCENFMTFDKMSKIIKSLIMETEVGLVITHVPSGELFDINYPISCNDDHKPLEYPIPKEDLLKNTFSFGQMLMDKISKFCTDIESSRKHCSVVFMTCYPTNFAPYYEKLAKEHNNKYPKHLLPNDLINKNPSYYDTMVMQCFVVVNQFIFSFNSKFGFETCDIFSPLMQPSKEIIFPLQSLPRGISHCEAAKDLFGTVRKYVNQLHISCMNKKFDFTLKGADIKKRKESAKYFKKLEEKEALSRLIERKKIKKEKWLVRKAEIDKRKAEELYCKLNKSSKPSTLTKTNKSNKPSLLAETNQTDKPTTSGNDLVDHQNKVPIPNPNNVGSEKKDRNFHSSIINTTEAETEEILNLLQRDRVHKGENSNPEIVRAVQNDLREVSQGNSTYSRNKPSRIEEVHQTQNVSCESLQGHNHFNSKYRKTNYIQGKAKNNTNSSGSSELYRKSFYDRKLLKNSNYSESNLLFDSSSLDRGTISSNSYKSRPGINLSGMNSGINTSEMRSSEYIYRDQAMEHDKLMGNSKNISYQQKLIRNSEDRSQIKHKAAGFAQSNYQTHQKGYETNFLTDHTATSYFMEENFIRNSQTSHVEPNFPRYPQASYIVDQNFPQNPQASYIDPNLLNNPQASYIDPNLLNNPQASYINPNFPQNTRASYIESKFPRNPQSTFVTQKFTINPQASHADPNTLRNPTPSYIVDQSFSRNPEESFFAQSFMRTKQGL